MALLVEASASDDSNLGEIPPLAIVEGAPYQEYPDDLFIPPDAMKVFLEAFEGPLDLLLYLIKRQNLDILNIPIAQVTQQYINYIDMMTDLKLELAAEYLVMAAILAEIKSRMLLPRHQEEDQEDEQDPRAYLMRKLMEYEIIKNAADDLDNLPRQERDTFDTPLDVSTIEVEKKLPSVQLKDLILAFQDVLQRVEQHSHHHISREALSVRERMSAILENLKKQDILLFSQLFLRKEGRAGVVVSFLAILELCKEGLLDFSEHESSSELSVRAAFS